MLWPSMRLRLNNNQKRLPFGGHHFFENSMNHLLKGETFDDVVRQLTDLRINNNVPMGDPEQEILIFYAKNYPWMVKYDMESTGVEQLSPRYQAWRRFVYNTWNKPPQKVVSNKEAAMRQERCLSCPYNQPLDWDETDESSELTRRAFLLRRGANLSQDIGFCTLHESDLGILTLVENPESYSARNKDTPNYPGCWF